MVNYKYRDLVDELLAGQDLVREARDNKKEADKTGLVRTFSAIKFYSSHKNNFTLSQREGLDLLVEGFSNICSIR